MNYHTFNQKGSPSRDLFKLLHKRMMPKTCWALDSDLELVEKLPVPFIVARLDFKMPGDTVSFTEAISYNVIINNPFPYNIPVYLVEADKSFKESEDPCEHRFTVYELLEADFRPNPPRTETKKILACVTWQELAGWEMGLRRDRKREMEQWVQQNSRWDD